MTFRWDENIIGIMIDDWCQLECAAMSSEGNVIIIIIIFVSFPYYKF